LYYGGFWVQLIGDRVWGVVDSISKIKMKNAKLQLKNSIFSPQASLRWLTITATECSTDVERSLQIDLF